MLVSQQRGALSARAAAGGIVHGNRGSMIGSRQHALVVARQLVRTFGSAPDPRRRAQAVMSELRRADDWSAAGVQGIKAVDAWLGGLPPVSALEPRLRDLLVRLANA